MAFFEQLIPVTISPGASSAPAFATSIQKLRGGAEYRNALWAHPLRTFNTSYGNRDRQLVEDELLAFAMSTMGSLHAFRAKDWSDFTATDEQIGTGDGVVWWFRLTKRYGTYVRRISKPDPATVTIRLDGDLVDPAGYVIDAVNGTVLFLVTPSVGQIITWSGEFHVPVRFEDDALGIVMTYYRVGEVPSVALTEVRVRENIVTEDYDLVREFLAEYDREELEAMLDLLDLHVNTQWGATA